MRSRRSVKTTWMCLLNMCGTTMSKNKVNNGVARRNATSQDPGQTRAENTASPRRAASSPTPETGLGVASEDDTQSPGTGPGLCVASKDDTQSPGTGPGLGVASEDDTQTPGTGPRTSVGLSLGLVTPRKVEVRSEPGEWKGGLKMIFVCDNPVLLILRGMPSLF
jgi:hypothetical protein